MLLSLLLSGCIQVDDLRVENTRLQEENLALAEEVSRLNEALGDCESIKTMEASAARSFDPPTERCVDGVFEGDPELLSATGMTRGVRLLPSPDGGLRIISIRRDSLADSCGFRNGDVVTSVAGTALESAEDWGTPEGAEVTFEVLRRGEPVAWSLELAP
jgi:C-terminal processing protease CtpA/Prc